MFHGNSVTCNQREDYMRLRPKPKIEAGSKREARAGSLALIYSAFPNQRDNWNLKTRGDIGTRLTLNHA